MSKNIRITPAARLVIDDAKDPVPELTPSMAQALQRAFDRSSADGLLYLASRTLDAALPAEFVFWRDLAVDFFERLCERNEGDAQSWAELSPPATIELQRRGAEAPPMRGLEYLSVDLLRHLWSELRVLVVREADDFEAGADAYLQSVNPLWRLLGRVTFHLAENKRQQEYPFAFMATYTHRLSNEAKLRHLPLGQALKQYAGANNRAALTSLLSPVRRASRESRVVRELLDTKALFQPQAWGIAEAHRFLLDIPRMDASGIVVRVPDWWKAGRPPRPRVEVRLGQERASQLDLDAVLDFSIHLALDGEKLTAAEHRQILESTEGLVLLRGKWVEVDQDKLKQALQHWEQLQQEHPDGLSFVKGMRLLSGADVDTRDHAEGSTAPDWSRVTAGNWLRETLEKIRDPSAIDQAKPGRQLRTSLRPYQDEGVRWLWFMHRLGLGACLADDMGLGKTIQVLALLLIMRRERGDRGRGAGPTLLVVPASLIGNWKAEIERFAPSLRVFYLHRSETDAQSLERVAAEPDKTLAAFDLVVTTYGLLRRLGWLAEREWQLVVLDEAQAIKNAGSAQTKAVKRLKTSGRIALTGTPVENQLGDLWSLLDFCCPGLLGSATQFKSFVKRLNERQHAAAYGPLRRLVRPYILRRRKTDPDVISDLPDKTEMRTECSLSKKQVTLYAQVVDELQRRLDHAEGMGRRGLVLAALMQFKQICNHPSQFLGQGNYAACDSGKLLRLKALCEEIADRQEKVLVFTQFRAVTEPLAGFLREVFDQPGLVLHGGTNVRKRQSLVRQFQDERGPPFFVISLKAGGSGLNLTAASHVVHFDRWWNPAVENQATDRAFRIGQKKNVLVHKFVCRGTVEEKIDRMIADKQQLSDGLLGEGAETALTEMSDDELIQLVSLDLNRVTDE